MSHPAGLPDLFLDRSLGRIKVPELLRQGGLRLVTLAEHYGVPGDQEVTDETWLEYAGSAGRVVFMKDENIRWRPAERRAVIEHGVRCFCLANQNVAASEMARRFLDNIDRIAQICSEDPGPFIYSVQQRRLVRLDLDLD